MSAIVNAVQDYLKDSQNYNFAAASLWISLCGVAFLIGVWVHFRTTPNESASLRNQLLVGSIVAMIVCPFSATLPLDYVPKLTTAGLDALCLGISAVAGTASQAIYAKLLGAIMNLPINAPGLPRIQV